MTIDEAIPWRPTHRHYKGGLYRLIGMGRIEAGLAEVAIYDNANGDLWVRPWTEFHGSVDENGYIPRFAEIAAPAPAQDAGGDLWPEEAEREPYMQPAERPAAAASAPKLRRCPGRRNPVAEAPIPERLRACADDGPESLSDLLHWQFAAKKLLRLAADRLKERDVLLREALSMHIPERAPLRARITAALGDERDASTPTPRREG